MITQDDRYEYCSICINRIFDKSKGILCGLTNKKADFIDECTSFETTEKIDLIELKNKSWEDRKNKRIENLTIQKVVRNFRRFYFLLSMFFIVLGLFYTNSNGKELDSTSALLYSFAVIFFSISFFINEKTTFMVIISSFILFLLLLVIAVFLMVLSLNTKTGFNLYYALGLLGAVIFSGTNSFLDLYQLFMKRKEEEMSKKEGGKLKD